MDNLIEIRWHGKMAGGADDSFRRGQHPESS